MPENNQLSERELEILRLVATGVSNKEIAQTLVISVNTVKVHLRNIFSKLEVSSRTEATMWAVREGIVDVPAQDNDSSDSLEDISPFSSWMQRNKLWITIGIVGVLLIGGVIIIRQLITNRAGEPELEPEVNRWQELSSLSSPRSNFAFSVYENQIYTIGGQTENEVSDLVERYDPQLERWMTLASKPTSVSDIGAAVIGGQIYVPGGRLASGKVTSVVEVYDPKNDEWDTITPLPKALSAFAITAFEGKLYLFGGWDGNQFVDTVYEFDPSTEQWLEREPLPIASGFSSAAVVGNRIYIIGGYDGKNILNRNDIYLPEDPEEPWLKGAPLPYARYGHGAASLGNVIYLVGGRSDEGALLSFQYIPQEDKWQQFGNLVDESWTNMGIVSSGSNLHIWGGELGDDLTDQHWSYQAIYTLVLPVIQQ